jgi:hypothetical protein
MANVTWLGEDELHGNGAGPPFTTAFGGIKFPKGQPVEIKNERFLERARKNQFFEVEGEGEFVATHPRRGRPPKIRTEELTDG